MGSQLNDRVGRWVASIGIDPARVPAPAELDALFAGLPDPCRPPADPAEIAAWERRHGFALPEGLRVWLALSNGFYAKGPLIHPITAIGPMVPFARRVAGVGASRGSSPIDATQRPTRSLSWLPMAVTRTPEMCPNSTPTSTPARTA